MQIQSVRDRLRALGAQPKHVSRIIRLWANALPQDHGKRDIETFLPARVREALPGLQAELEGLATLHEEHPGDDGSARLLVRLGDGQLAESVLMPPGRIPGLCVSTQIGCAVGCTFCMTGQSGLIRQLTSGEIVAQVALARRLRPVQKVVFMGMGEPAHNLDAVMEAIDLLGTVGNIGHKNLVFSTVGDERAFERLGQGPVKPALPAGLLPAPVGAHWPPRSSPAG
jgi:23S rRNA (adenine2503-C2)-methyltransferase